MLTIQGLSYRYGRRGAPVLNGVNLALARGEIGILLGRNGSGKTTLFRNILGLCTPDSGSIRLDGLEMTSLSPRRRARYIACVPQDICFGALTVFDSVLLGRLSRFGLQAGAADHAAASQVLEELGLSALSGRNVTELSGGEAQRVKLATELSRRATGRTVYILDEPTTGLHADDVRKLLEVLQRLTDGGNTVLVIEHNLDVIKCADYIIDLGPEGGVGGGTVVACGTPEEIAACPASYTGQYLKKYLK